MQRLAVEVGGSLALDIRCLPALIHRIEGRRAAMRAEEGQPVADKTSGTIE